MKHAYWLISLYFFAVLVDAKPGDVRVDEDPNYWGYQDIKKALSNKDKKSWMFYRTLRSTDRAKNKCVYAEVKEKQDRGKVLQICAEIYKGRRNQGETNVICISL
uniref:Salivary lipocalin n=1 Tax=Ixodes ricinus TaxID=34613 RepID=V5HSI5_IXORI